MKHFTFHVTLNGYGDDIWGAWGDAIEGFMDEPGGPADEPYTEEEYDEEEDENA